MTFRLILAAAAAAALALPLSAHDYSAGDVTVDHPAIPATSPVARSAAGYMTIRNSGEEAETLLEVRTEDGPMAQLHLSQMQDGVATMIEQERVEIPAGGEVEFGPGGLHVMFMQIEGGLAEGEEIDATLVFERAGEVPVTFHVEAQDGDGHADHGDHSDHGAH